MVVVLGAYATEIEQASVNKEVIYTVNEDWENGLSSSISFGLKTALNIDAEIKNAIITVADQVHISSKIFEKLHHKHQLTKKNIVACTYSQTTGTPALFNKKYFGELLALSGKNGAKSLTKKYINDAATVPFGWEK